MNKKMVLAAVMTSLFVSQGTYGANAESRVTDETANPTIIDQSQGASREQLDFVLSRVRSVEEEQQTSSAQGIQSMQAPEEILNYAYIDTENAKQYVYEKSSSDAEGTLTVEDLDADALAPAAAEPQAELQSAAAAAAISDGIGTRTTISQGLSGNLFTADILLGTNDQMKGSGDQLGKVYAGVLAAGGKAIDAGVNYTTSLTGEGRWRANMLYFNGSSQLKGVYKEGYKEATTRNGYKPGTTVSYSLWRNYSDATISNAARMKVSGYAICGDAYCTKAGNPRLTTIVEMAGSNIGTLKYWKQLVVIAESPNGTTAGKAYGKFSNIKIDGKAYTPVLNEKTYSTVSINGNSVAVTVSK